ncbi:MULTISPECIES: LysR family transcriptional regulator [Terrisporobacter]|uniref:LysR family transcriptional regulator n=1 Tax=Terrisporobacter muris TaxID=2963284 RepID=A0A9X2M8P6_9FIRM|nr:MULTISPECIES: LysR family transcriptional regulator [Terrisporobacter]MCR1822787.1 LysR family transcriptional regulator [Terrisporobacter muris]MDU6986282.1 LysR family transcriptional regulator [Terrisporobacter othiniensis]MDY3373681.1 LysR family transcriptional regulator [Terrisporobacter othiniensis]
MSFKKLKYIITIAECRSISKAACELFISQPSLSSILSNMEKDLGVSLFDRSTNPISLTYAGEKYVETAKKILSLESNLKKELIDISTMKKGKITIGIPSVRGTHVLPLILPKFKKEYPGIDIHVIEGDSNYLEECLLSGKVDLVLTSLPSTDKRITCELLYEEKIMLACKKGYLNSQHLLDINSNIVNLNSLKDVDFILTKKNHRIRKLTEYLFDLFNFKPKIILETSNTATAFRLATSGIGVCFVSEMILNTTKPMNEFDLFNIENSPVKWNISISYLNSSYLSNVERSFIDFAKTVLKENAKNNSII